MVQKTKSNIVQNTYDRSQSIMVTTTWDRLYVKLDPHIKALKKERSWLSALSLIVTIGAALCSAEFKSILGLSADTVNAIFIVALLVSFVYLIIAGWNAFQGRNETLDHIVDDVFKDMTYKVLIDEPADTNNFEQNSEENNQEQENQEPEQENE